MDILSIVLLAIGLAMDCFAVSLAQGVSTPSAERRWPSSVLLMAVCFGIFQGGMPLIAYFAGSLFVEFFTRWSSYIALILLALIGGKMLWEAWEEKRNGTSGEQPEALLTFGKIILLAIATSIDALSIGVLFIPVPEVVWLAVAIIALTSTAFALFGYLLGRTLGRFLPFNANILGGCILILLGIKIFIEGIC